MTGIYAEVRDADNQIVWSSASTVNAIPDITDGPVGDWRYLHNNEGSDDEVRALQFQAIYVAQSGAEPRFIIQVVEDAVEFADNLSTFDRNLSVSLLLAALACCLYWQAYLPGALNLYAI